jgi:hypothetical protein
VARNWRTATVLLILLAITGGWIWRVADRGVAQIETELRAGIEADLWTSPTQEDSEQADHIITNHFATTLDGTARPYSGTIESMTLRGETAIVQLVTQPTADQPALRQT